MFLVFDWIDSGAAPDRKSIVVDRNALLTYTQYRAKYFDAEQSGKFLDTLSAEDLDRIVQEYIREEVLYREALALGLDRDDFIMRQRMVQKMEFISRDLSAETIEVTEADVRTYYEEHRDDYFEPAQVTFTHIFFDDRNGGREAAEQRARTMRTALDEHPVPFNEGPRQGDRFLYHANYVERARGYVGSHFGEVLAEAVFSVAPRDDCWYGPYPSTFGVHFIMVTKRTPDRFMDLDEVYARAEDDARRTLVQKRNDEIIQDILDGYTIEVTLDAKLKDKVN